MSGTAGTISFYRGEDPLRADKLNSAFVERLYRGGDTMTGFLTLFADPIDPFHAATKQYVDRLLFIGPGGAVTVSRLNISNIPLAQPDGSPPVGAVRGDVYDNGGFLCIAH